MVGRQGGGELDVRGPVVDHALEDRYVGVIQVPRTPQGMFRTVRGKYGVRVEGDEVVVGPTKIREPIVDGPALKPFRSPRRRTGKPIPALRAVLDSPIHSTQGGRDGGLLCVLVQRSRSLGLFPEGLRVKSNRATLGMGSRAASRPSGCFEGCTKNVQYRITITIVKSRR